MKQYFAQGKEVPKPSLDYKLDDLNHDQAMRLLWHDEVVAAILSEKGGAPKAAIKKNCKRPSILYQSSRLFDAH